VGNGSEGVGVKVIVGVSVTVAVIVGVDVFVGVEVRVAVGVSLANNPPKVGVLPFPINEMMITITPITTRAMAP
jgi:hypothetical protein